MRHLPRLAAGALSLAATLLRAYALAVLLGALWTTRPAGGEPARTIHVVATPIHAEIIVPIHDDVADWRGLVESGGFAGGRAERDLLAEVATHAAFGWGAESFYLNVRHLADIRPAFVLDGIWDDSLVHVTLMTRPQEASGVVQLDLTEEGYRTLIAELAAAFARPDGAVVPLAGASYHHADAFFRGTGTYSPLTTCNEWVGARLRHAGVAVGRFTPFSQTLLFSLPSSPQGAEERGD